MPYDATANFTGYADQDGLTDLSVQPYAGISPSGPVIAATTATLVKVGTAQWRFAAPVPSDADGGTLVSASQGVIDVQAFGGRPVAAAGGAVTVAPLTLAAVAEAYAANGVHPLKLSCVQGEAASWLLAITDSLAEPIDLTGRSLRFVVRDGNDANRFKAELNDGIELVDATGGTLRVTLTADQTDLRADDGSDYLGQWVLWDLTTNKALGRGAFRIAAAVKDVA